MVASPTQFRGPHTSVIAGATSFFMRADGTGGWGRPTGLTSRPTDAKSGVLVTTDGGRTWKLLAAWDWWSFEPIPLPS